MTLCKFFQKRKIKSLLWSDIISIVNPFSQYHSLKNSSASCSAVSVVVVGMIRTSDPSQSMKVTMLLKPSSVGSGPMKSMATGSQRSLGTGRGCRGPICFVVRALLRWQSAHAGMYAFSRSRHMFGQ